MKSNSIVDGWVRVPKESWSDISPFSWDVTRSDGSVYKCKAYKDDRTHWLLPWSVLHKVKATGFSAPSMPSTSITPVSLWDEQEAPVRVIVERLQDVHGGILRAAGGRGKTTMSLEIARRLGLRTIVFVHQDFLKDQWAAELKAKLPDAKFGFIQGSNMCDVDACDFVIAMVTTLSSRTYTKDFYQKFGTLIFDETHRYGSDTWSKEFEKFSASYRLGVTATADRKDGRYGLVNHHIGPILYDVEALSLRADVIFVDTCENIHERKFTRARMIFENGVRKRIFTENLPVLTSLLCESPSRTQLLIRCIRRMYKTRSRILVLCDRVDQITSIVSQLTAEGYDISAFTGKRKKGSPIPKSKILVATYPLVKEGFNVPELDTLVHGCLQADVRQACWRIARDFAGKKKPLIIDFYDREISFSKSLASKRNSVYTELEYSVKSHPKSVFDKD